jgi:hypothetical protein
MAPMLLHLAAGCTSSELQAPSEAERAVSDDALAPPAWPKSRVLHRAPAGLGDVVVEGARAYVPAGGHPQESGDNEILAIALPDGPATVLVEAADQIPGDALAVDGEFLYWSSARGISRVPLAGGATELIVAAVEGVPPAELVVDQDQLFWIEWTGEGPARPVRSAPKAGGEAVALTPPVQGANGLCVDGDTVWFTTPEGIQRVPRGGGTPTRVGNGPSDATVQLIQDRDALYTVRADGGRLTRIPKNGMAPAKLADGALWTAELAVDLRYVYFVDQGDGGWRLRRVPKEGGQPETLDTGPTAAFVRHLAIGPAGPVFVGRDTVWTLAGG